MKKARQSVMNPKTQPRVSNIPASFSGTWSGANQSEPIAGQFAPRSTVLKVRQLFRFSHRELLFYNQFSEEV